MRAIGQFQTVTLKSQFSGKLPWTRRSAPVDLQPPPGTLPTHYRCLPSSGRQWPPCTACRQPWASKLDEGPGWECSYAASPAPSEPARAIAPSSALSPAGFWLRKGLRWG